MPRPRAPRSRARYPERRRRDGAVLPTHNHISFLQGLLDRPDGRARSKRDLIAAALPYVKRYRPNAPCWWTLNLAANSLHPSWVDWRRKGTRLEFTLLPRGRAILSGEVPAHILGFGPHVSGTVRAR